MDINNAECDLSTALQTSITEPIQPSLLDVILRARPFVPVPKALNVRDIGINASPNIRPGFIYRSGFLWHITAKESILQGDTEAEGDLRLALHSRAGTAVGPDYRRH